MGYTFSGTVRDPLGTGSISGAEVRLYDKVSNDLIATTTSDSLGKWSIDCTTRYETPWQFFAIAYDSNHKAGIVDSEKSFYSFGFAVPKDIVDTNKDLVVIPIPGDDFITLYKVRVQSITSAVSSGSLAIYNNANGVGSSISLAFTAGVSDVSSTGSISSNDYLYLRSVTPCGLSNIFVELIFESPLLVFPLC